MSSVTRPVVLPDRTTLRLLILDCLDWLDASGWFETYESERPDIVEEYLSAHPSEGVAPKPLSGPAQCRYCDRTSTIGSTWFQQAVLGQLVWVCAECAIEQPGCEPAMPDQEVQDEIPY